MKKSVLIAATLLAVIGVSVGLVLKGRHGWRMYRAAGKKDGVDKVRTLLEEGADVNYQSPRDHDTALHRAADKGRLAVVKYLVEIGKADVNIQNKDGETPLHDAADEGYLEIVKYLIEVGKADQTIKDEDGETALDKAKDEGHKDVVKYLQKVMK